MCSGDGAYPLAVERFGGAFDGELAVESVQPQAAQGEGAGKLCGGGVDAFGCPAECALDEARP